MSIAKHIHKLPLLRDDNIDVLFRSLDINSRRAMRSGITGVSRPVSATSQLRNTVVVWSVRFNLEEENTSSMINLSMLVSS